LPVSVHSLAPLGRTLAAGAPEADTRWSCAAGWLFAGDGRTFKGAWQGLGARVAVEA
jgi:hypothetical protein